MKPFWILAISAGISIWGCQKPPGTDSAGAASDTGITHTPRQDSLPSKQIPEKEYDPSTTNQEIADKIAAFLAGKHKSNLSILTEKDREFSFYEVDLNDDNKNEYFVYMQGRFFCGSGGCSFYLLNHDFSVHSHFTVTNPPLFRSSATTGGWHDLILLGDFDQDKENRKFIHLKFNESKNKYPSNPSVIEQVETAPDVNDFVMWSEGGSQAKIFSF